MSIDWGKPCDSKAECESVQEYERRLGKVGNDDAKEKVAQAFKASKALRDHIENKPSLTTGRD